LFCPISPTFLPPPAFGVFFFLPVTADFAVVPSVLGLPGCFNEFSLELLSLFSPNACVEFCSSPCGQFEFDRRFVCFPRCSPVWGALTRTRIRFFLLIVSLSYVLLISKEIVNHPGVFFSSPPRHRTHRCGVTSLSCFTSFVSMSNVWKHRLVFQSGSM